MGHDAFLLHKQVAIEEQALPGGFIQRLRLPGRFRIPDEEWDAHVEIIRPHGICRIFTRTFPVKSPVRPAFQPLQHKFGDHIGDAQKLLFPASLLFRHAGSLQHR
ncbi:hypothetical protein D3C77_284530 [compost metagenome]